MVWLFPFLAVAVGVVALRRRSSTSSSTARPNLQGKGWADPDAPRRIRELADRLGWAGLGDFLAAVAYWEARGNSQAGEDEGNRARGWFGMRPKSARVADLSWEPSALKEEPAAVALAAWYAWRLRSYARAGQELDWLALRRGWRLPSLVGDIEEADDQSRSVREHFAQSLAAAGVDQSFMYRPAMTDFSWPGMTAAFSRINGHGQ